MIEFTDAAHYEIYIEVDRLYHSCQTSEGRCIVIADYIRRLLNDESQHGTEKTVADAIEKLAALSDANRVMPRALRDIAARTASDTDIGLRGIHLQAAAAVRVAEGELGETKGSA